MVIKKGHPILQEMPRKASCKIGWPSDSVTSGEPDLCHLAPWAHQCPQTRFLPHPPRSMTTPWRRTARAVVLPGLSLKSKETFTGSFPKDSLRSHWPELSHMPTPKPVMSGLPQSDLPKSCEHYLALSSRKNGQVSNLPLYPVTCAFHLWWCKHWSVRKQNIVSTACRPNVFWNFVCWMKNFHFLLVLTW